MTKVTYYMCPCDTCGMISEMMEMNDLNMEFWNEYKTKGNSLLLQRKEQNGQ